MNICSCTLVLAADLSTYDLYRYMYCLHWRLGQPWALPAAFELRPARRALSSPSTSHLVFSLDALDPPDCVSHLSAALFYHLQSAISVPARVAFFCHARPCCPPASPPGGGGGSHLARW